MINLLRKPLFWTNVIALGFAGWLIAGSVFGWINPVGGPPMGQGALTTTLETLLGGNLWQRYTDEGRGYSVSVASAEHTGTESLLFLKNPNASGKLLRIKTISYSFHGPLHPGIAARFELFKNPTRVGSSGAAVPITKLKSSSGASVATTIEGAVVAPSGQLIEAFILDSDATSVVVRNHDLGIILEPNDSLVIMASGLPGPEYLVNIAWVEE